jgi:hypothetical protein
MLQVSNTRTTAHGTCTRQEHYMYNMKITPRVPGIARYRGTMGHEALAAYYRAMQQGYSLDDCLEAAITVLKVETMRIISDSAEDPELVSVLKQIKHLLKGYMNYWRVEPFKVLAVEETMTAPINDDVEYLMILDLLVEMTAGPYRGSLIVMDHKFVYNFKNQVELELDAQLPKYIKTCRENGYFVTRGIFNQIRYREQKDQSPEKYFLRKELKSTKKEWETIWSEQRDAAIEIAAGDRPVRRSLNPYVCKGCDFAQLCKAELRGDDISMMVNTLFKPRESREEKIVVDDAA